MTVSQLRKELESFLPDTPVLVEHLTKPILQDLSYVGDGRSSADGKLTTRQVCVLSALTESQHRAIERKYPETIPGSPLQFPPPVSPSAAPQPPAPKVPDGKFGHNVFSVIIEMSQEPESEDHIVLAEIIAAPFYRIRPGKPLDLPTVHGNVWAQHGCESYDEAGCAVVPRFDPRKTTPAHLAIDLLDSFLIGDAVPSTRADSKQLRIWKPGRWWLDFE
jgi:hypothetical protein